MNPSAEMFRFYALTEKRNGMKAKEVHNKLVTAWADDAPGLSTIQRYFKDFEDGNRNSFNDANRPGRPVTASGDDNVGIVRDLIEEHPKLSTRDIESITGISHMVVHKILTERLQLRHVCSVWVPHRLTAQNKLERVSSASEIKNKLLAMGDERYSHYAIEDETWIFFDPVCSKAENKVWIRRDEARPQVIKANPMTPRKTMLVLAFTANKRFSVDTIPYGTTMTSELYVEFLRATGNKWRGLRSSPIHLNELTWQHDNARSHVAKNTISYIQSRNMSLLKQAPYSPDLNICDRCIFNLLKTDLRQQTYDDHNEVKTAALQVLNGLDEKYLRQQVDNLINHCNTVINIGGDYFTK